MSCLHRDEPRNPPTSVAVNGGTIGLDNLLGLPDPLSARIVDASSFEKATMRTIETWIDISASPARVWDVLTNFDAYPQWNPFITRITGIPSEGTRLRVHIKPPGRSGMTFKPTIVALTRQQKFTWLGHLLLPGLFDGEHSFQIEGHGNSCRFHQSERFSGILVALFGAGLFDATRHGFEAMNTALKEQAEA
jgi:hypothetical protein